MSDFFRITSRDIASNPVARAIAKKRVESAIRDFLLTCYFLQDGSDQRLNYLAAARVLMVALLIRETPVMRGALSCCEQASNRGFRWKAIDAVAIDEGLCDALEVIKQAKAEQVQKAWAQVMDMERKAECPA